MVRRRKTWRQPTPIMQLIAIKSNVDGHRLNCVERLITPEKFELKFCEFLDELEELMFFIELGRWS